jgi:Spy/CpxP family protein refolding chaperone
MKRIILMIAVLVSVSANAWAFRNGCGMGPGIGMVTPFHWASNLELTESQKAEIQTRQQAFAEEMSPLRDKLFSRRMELRELWSQTTPDQARISSKQQEIRDLQSQIQELATQYQLDCRELLTPEQKEKLGTSVAYQGGMRGGRGWGGHGW